MQRAGRICRDKFDLDFFMIGGIAFAKAVTSAENVFDDVERTCLGEKEVNNPGPAISILSI